MAKSGRDPKPTVDVATCIDGLTNHFFAATFLFMFVYSPTKQSSMEGSPAHRNDIRRHNSALVLRMLWSDENGASRSDIARTTKLSKATVSAIVNDLMASGLIDETHQRAPSGGRPGTILKFQYDCYSIIGVEMGASHVSVVRTNLAGKISESKHENHRLRGDPVGGIELTNRLTAELIETAQSPVIGIGVGVPTPLHSETPGQLSATVLPEWRTIDLRAALETPHQLPLKIENDANLGALAEHWWGSGQGVTDFTYVKVSTGVGAGLIIGGDIYRGPGGIAGELGHMIVDASGDACQINDLVGSEQIVDQALALARMTKQRPSWSTEPLTLPRIIDAAKQGEPLAVEVVQQAGRWLGIALANLYNLINPSRVILGGPLTEAGDVLMSALSQTLKQHTLHTPQVPPEVRVTSLGQEAIALGGATALLQEVLTDPRLLRRDFNTAQSTATAAAYFHT